MITRHISSIGVELEGGWITPVPAQQQMHGDGSIEGPILRGRGAAYVGEIPSPAFTTMALLEAWIVQNHPHLVHESCGLHVHIKLDPDNYARLMDESFRLFFIEKMTAYGEENAETLPDDFISRLTLGGGNGRVFCSPKYDPEQQILMRGRDVVRYGMWNFCWSVHGTAECRLLPMFDNAAASMHGIKTVVGTVTTFLNRNRKAIKIDLSVMESELERLAETGPVEPAIEII